MSRATDKLTVAGFAPAVVDFAGAIGQHAGCNLSGAAIVRSRSAACRLHVTQAQDVPRDLHMPAPEVLRAARVAVHDHILVSEAAGCLLVDSPASARTGEFGEVESCR